MLFGALLAAPGGRYRLQGEVLDDAPQGEVGELAQRYAERYRQRLEAVVRNAPEQYLWSHRLWKRQPHPPAPPAAGAPAAR